MRYDRKEYEIKIANSPLFSLDKETQYNDYKKEALKMVEYLYCYLCAGNNEKYSEYGQEIVELATRCINNYDVSKGVFLHYFNKSWKNEYKIILRENFENKKYRGVHIPENKMRNVRKYIKLAKSRGVDCTTQDFAEMLADATDLSEHEVMTVIELCGIKVTSNISQNQDSDEFDALNIIPSDENIEDSIIRKESLYDILEKIESAYNSLQDRQKKIISDVITAKICDTIGDIDIVTKHFEFINIEMFEKYKKIRKVPTQREIAEKYKRDEASISRSIKQFVAKIDVEID